ncbi:DUF3667 domain-containing protein [Flavisolibacter nicotianae]|uniref:DUF3667 domain-containing protein n=1 Tax=Flavisolibacter nicotianae TaxID=2364882 RepID=UPI000EAE1403|nr:DUF3667 domain-containing protein [Flavisolibacter nicotianae]
MATCLNCGSIITENYCPKCGQKKEVQRLTWQSLILEVFHFFSHIDKGFIFTSYKLLIRPDKVIGEYLEGKRKKYFKPASLYLIWVAMHLLVFQLIPEWMHYKNQRTGNLLWVRGGEYQVFIVNHASAFGLLLLPILSFFLWLIVSRLKLNYIENFITILYSLAAIEMLICFQIVFVGLLLRINFLTNAFLIQVQVVAFLWTFYCFVLFFRKKRIKILIPRILLALLIGIVVNNKVTELLAELILKLKHS